MTDITALQVLQPIATWIGYAFTALDTIRIFNFTALDIMIAIGILDITQWFVFRMIDSPKSDN